MGYTQNQYTAGVILLLALKSILSTGTFVSNKLPLWTWECENSRCVPFRATNVERLQSLTTCNMLCSSTPLWPHPTGPVTLSTTAVPVRADLFQLQTSSTPSATVQSHLEMAFRLFQEDLHNMEGQAKGFAEWRGVAVHITIIADEDPRMKIDTDETYQISLKPISGTSGALKAEINAISFCGARHGLDTLSQMIWLDTNAETLFMLTSAEVKDSPRFGYRGIMLDTARNFIPVPALIRTIDAMAASKLNTLHWHVSDSQSFPLELSSLPELSKIGSYGPGAVYTTNDVYELVKRARARGIRILIEVDTPAHVSCAWNIMQSGFEPLVLCDDIEPWCNDPPCGQLNPRNLGIYDVLEALYAEIIRLTNVDDMFHLGGDDITEECWRHHLNVTNVKDLWLEFTQSTLQRLEAANNGKLPNATIMWSTKYSESFKKELKEYAPSMMLQVRSKHEQTVAKGIRTVISDEAWDLNTGMGAWYDQHNVFPYNSWQQVYDHRPWGRGDGDRSEGGEATVWSWTLGVDGLDARLWPRAAALAERLWSDRPETATRPVHARLDIHRARLVARGIKAAPLWSMWCTHNPYTCV